MTAATPDGVNAGNFMSKHSYLWHQARVCMSLARITDDPALKERYEDLAVDFAQNAERERDDFGDVKAWDLESRNNQVK